MSSAAQDEFNALFRNQGCRDAGHPEDTPHSSDTSESPSENEDTLRTSDDNDDASPTRTSNTMASAVYHIPRTTTFDANTGPKGVIADAKAFDRARKRSFRQTLYAFSNGLSGNASDKRTGSNIAREKSPGADVSADDGEDEFMLQWRASRMIELQTTGHDPRTRRHSPSKRRYGRMDAVDAVGYLDAVEKVPAETVVVVCIYDDKSTVSGIVEDALGDLARKHELTRFVKLPYQEAEMAVEAVPAILAYRGGDMLANLVSVIDEIPAGRDMSSASLESLLRQHRVLS